MKKEGGLHVRGEVLVDRSFPTPIRQSTSGLSELAGLD